MGNFGANGVEVRGSACGFPAEGHKDKVKASEGRFLAAGGGKNSPLGSRDTSAPGIYGQETGDNGRVGGPAADF